MAPHARLVGLAAALLVGCGAAPSSSPPPPKAVEAPAERVDGPAAKKLVRDGARLIDVRTPQEYADKHVEGAENVPVDTIEARDLGPKDAPIVVYCASGKRSARAAAALRSKGHTRVYDLGGMSSWDD